MKRIFRWLRCSSLRFLPPPFSCVCVCVLVVITQNEHSKATTTPNRRKNAATVLDIHYRLMGYLSPTGAGSACCEAPGGDDEPVNEKIV